MSTVTILLADDHGVVRKGLRYLLEREEGLRVVGEAASGSEAIRRAAELEPDVVLMDLAMPGLGGIDATAEIVRQRPETAVVVLSMHSDESYLARALSAGARAYLLKELAEEDLVRAVRAVVAGQPYFSQGIARALVEHHLDSLRLRAADDPYEKLTDRERQILRLLAQGRSNKEVASLLSLSVHTVDTHRANLMQKLSLRNTAEIVLYAVRKKLILF